MKERVALFTFRQIGGMISSRQAPPTTSLSSSSSFQVEFFKKEVFSYLREHHGVNARVWHRWSDQCSAQFKSKYTLHKLKVAAEELGLPQDAVIMWHHFEVYFQRHDHFFF